MKNDNIKVKSVAKLHETYLGQTVEDFLYDCTNAEDITIKIYDIHTGKILQQADGIGQLDPDILNANFYGMECQDKQYFAFYINVDSDYPESAYYKVVSDFLEDVSANGMEVIVYDIDTSEYLFKGNIENMPASIKNKTFVSFDSPDTILINIDSAAEGPDFKFNTSELDLSEKYSAYDYENMFKDDDICIYLFPGPGSYEDRCTLKEYNLEFLGVNFGPFSDEQNDVVKGKYKDLERFCNDYIGGYEMHPDYLYHEDNFAGDIYPEDSLPTAEIDLSEDYEVNSKCVTLQPDYSLKIDLDTFNTFMKKPSHTLAELKEFADQLFEINKYGTGYKKMITKYWSPQGRRPDKSEYLTCCLEGYYLYTEILNYIKKRDGLSELPDTIPFKDFILYMNTYKHIFYPKQQVEKSEIDLSESVIGEKIDSFIDDLYLMRQSSIQKDGEYSMGNLIFKEFRNKGYLDNLKKLKLKEIEKDLSVK